MKPASLLVVLALAAAGSRAQEAELGTNDLGEACLLAKRDNLDVLLVFTISWFPDERRLRDDILAKPAFRESAAKQFVIVDLDLSKTTHDGDRLALLWAKLCGPTHPAVVLADADGRPFAQAATAATSPEQYLAAVSKLREKRALRDAALARARHATTAAATAEALAQALDAVTPELVRFYGKELEQLLALGAAVPRQVAQRFTRLREREKLALRLAEATADLEIDTNQQRKTAIARSLEALLAEHAPQGDDRRRALLLLALALCNFDEEQLTRAIRCLDEAKKIATTGWLEHAENYVRTCCTRTLTAVSTLRAAMRADEERYERLVQAAQSRPQDSQSRPARQ